MSPGELLEIGGRQVAVTATDRCAARGCTGCPDHRLSGIDVHGEPVIARWRRWGWEEIDESAGEAAA